MSDLPTGSAPLMAAGGPEADALTDAAREAYLQRIEQSAPARPDAAALKALHRAHIENIAFENLDVMSSRPLSLTTQALVKKVVEERRGGFCFELNVAFARLLVALGFPVQFHSGQVVNPESGALGPPCDHLALLVQTAPTSGEAAEAEADTWLCDVGFGRGFREPLHLGTAEAQAQEDPDGPFRLCGPDPDFRPFGEQDKVSEAAQESWNQEVPESLDLWRERPEDLEAGGRLVYRIALEPRPLEDFSELFHFHQSAPESPFTQTVVWTRPTPAGRETLLGRDVVTDSPKGRRIHELKSDRGVRNWIAQRQPPPKA